MKGLQNIFWNLLVVSILTITTIYFVLWQIGYTPELSIIPGTVFGREVLILRNSTSAPNASSTSTSTSITPQKSVISFKKRKSYKTNLNFTWMARHQVYKQFKIPQLDEKKVVTIVIIVSSAPGRTDRRNAIRDTWWTQCRRTKRVVPECIFMTDYLTPQHKFYKQVQNESATFKDIRFQHVASGVTFGLRFLNHLVYAMNTYEFDYFMRIDDDHFLCCNKFLQEVPTPMIKNFHWGWVHTPLGIQRPEESIIIFSRDVVVRFVTQDKYKMLCHPWADQMVAEWMARLGITVLLRHDGRIYHHPPVSQRPELMKQPNVCHSFMALHGAYVNDMRVLWGHRGPPVNATGDLWKNSSPINIVRPFDWRIFSHVWKYEPKPCISNPTWDTSKQMGGGSSSYQGRQSGFN